MPAARFAEILEVLGRHHVEFVVVGGVAAVLRGAPVATFDLDIVHRRTDENVERLLAAFAELDATYRGDARGLRPGASHLRSAGHQLLATRLGPLDALGAVGDGAGYAELLPWATEVSFRGVSVHVLSLERLIAEKERVGRPKDLAALPVLRATLEELRKRPSRPPDGG